MGSCNQKPQKKELEIDLCLEKPSDDILKQNIQIDNYQLPQQVNQQIENVQFPEYNTISTSGSGSLNRIKYDNEEEDLSLELAALIITICQSSSYDSLFTSVKQQAEKDTRVRVYQADFSALQTIVKLLQSPQKIEESVGIFKELIQDINVLEANNIVFNWECCCGCASETFGSIKGKKMCEMIAFLIEKGYFLMFSDFSLKALIHEWEERVLGPNVFVKIGEISGSFDLKFKEEVLKECESSQLQKLGDLCEKGECNVHAMGGTILYSVDWSKTDHDKFETQLLTLVTKVENGQDPLEKNNNKNKNIVCQVDSCRGVAGHVMLSYPSGGKILTSMGHWVELMKLDTNAEQLLKVAERDYGNEYAYQMRQEMEECNDEVERLSYVKCKAANFVQQSAPCRQKKSKY